MMKKMIAALLALMMLFSVAAFAEDAGASYADLGDAVKNALDDDHVPAGYQYYQEEVDGVVYFTLLPADDELKPLYMGSVAHSEEFDDYTLNVASLNDEQLDQMKAVLGDDLFNPSFSFSKTAHGLDLLIMNENDVATDIAEIMTVYHGYIITVSAFTLEGELTQADIDLAIQYLFDRWTVDAE